MLLSFNWIKTKQNKTLKQITLVFLFIFFLNRNENRKIKIKSLIAKKKKQSRRHIFLNNMSHHFEIYIIEKINKYDDNKEE